MHCRYVHLQVDRLRECTITVRAWVVPALLVHCVHVPIALTVAGEGAWAVRAGMAALATFLHPSSPGGLNYN
jgi:hypothetical protein